MAFTVQKNLLIDPEMDQEITAVLEKRNIQFSQFARDAFANQLRIEKATEGTREKAIEKISKEAGLTS